MSTNPKKPDRPRDMSQLAERVVDITIGEVDDEPEMVDQAARKRGEARAKKLSPERRKEIAKRAVIARWENEG